MLLVRFTREEDASGPEERASGSSSAGQDASLEAWVPGARLADLPEQALVEVLAGAVRWRGSGADAPFFVEEGGRRGR